MAQPSGHPELIGGELLLGVSTAIGELRREIRRLARGWHPVLIVGETGTGKELVARLIHLNSPRSGKPYVPFNCATLQESLAESELFGHERGAFTGAEARRDGLFDQAHEGTLFLDEIGEMPLSVQAKFLRVLDNREFQRLGGRQPIRRDVRIVAATNRDLEALWASGSFRLDLLQRIRVGLIVVPPLRERREDILPLAEHFCREGAAWDGIETPRIGASVCSALLDCDWKGNVREIRNVIENMLTHGVEEFALEHVPRWFDRGALSTESAASPASPSTERDLLLAALEQNQWKRDRTAKALRCSRTTLWRKLVEHGIQDRTRD